MTWTIKNKLIPYWKIWREKNKKLGRCLTCGKKMSKQSKRYCLKHLKARRQQKLKDYARAVKNRKPKTLKYHQFL